MFTQDNLDQVLNGTVVDNNGDKIGKVGDIYFDDVTNKPSWVTVNTGLFGNSSSFIPLDQASMEGDTIRVPFSKDKVKDAPRIDADRHLDVDEERELYAYYGANYDAGRTTTTDPDHGADNGADAQAGYADTNRARTTDPDHGADNGADAQAGYADTNRAEGGVVRHEERLNVGTERHEAGRVRLRKHVVTEQQSVTVPVTREEVRIEREPITGEARPGELRDGVREGEDVEVTLHDERVVVDKETVPVERVSLGKDVVTEQRQVTENVSHEEVEIDRAGGRTDGRAVADGDYDNDGKRGLGDKLKDKLDRDNDGKVL